MPFSSPQWQSLLRWRLGVSLLDIPLPVGTKCPKCFSPLEPYGDHFLSCTALGTYQRHNAVRDAVAELYQQAGFDVEREVALPTSEDRPADVFVHGLLAGTSAAVDVSVTHPLHSSCNLAEACNGTALAAVVDRKKRMYQDRCTLAGWHFYAIVAETTGAWSKDAHHLMYQLTSKLSMQKGAPACDVGTQAWYKLSSALALGISRQLASGIHACQQLLDQSEVLRGRSSAAP